MPARPFDPVRILGCSADEALALFHGRPVTPGEAEAIAEQSYPWRRHVHDPDSYWVTIAQAAEILGLTGQQVRRMLARGRLPFVQHASGVRLMRREQIEALKGRFTTAGGLPVPVPRAMRSSRARSQ